MSHAAPGQLAAYNSLQDKHLSGYFNNGRMKRHLVKSGLITKRGKIIDEKTYRLNMAKKEHKKHVRDLLATAIIHKALDMERTRQHEIRKRLDEVYKVELVRKVKEDRKKKGDEDILPLLTPRERSARRRRHVRPATAPAGLNGTAQPSEIHYDENTGRLCYTIEGGQETAMNSYMRDDEDPNGSPYTRAYPGTYPVPAPPPAGTPRRPRPNSSVLARKRTRPLRFHYLARTEPAVAHRVQLQSMAEVTMKFLGPSLMLTNSLFPEDRLSEVMVLQQHCGGSTLCVFRELLPPNTIFTFVSRRHRGAPFGLTFYIDSLQDIRLSSCCEYKHKPGHILGGRNGHFQFVQVEGAAPCYRCQVASGVRDHRSKDSSEQEGEENRSKTFLTQDEANQSRESFDVIITKVDPSEKEEQGIQRITIETTPSGYKMIIPHSAEKVDDSTQTPRDEKEDTAASNEGEEEKENSDESSAEEKEKEEKDEEKQDEQGEDATAGKYDDEDFEDEEGNEEKSTKDSEDEKPKDEEKDSDKEEESKTDDYNDDFNSDKEESDKESDDETKQESDKESADEAKQESDKESKQSDSDAEEIHDETEKKDDIKDDDKEEEDEVEVEDETEEKKKEDKENQEDNDSVHDSDSDMKPSRTVSFDEDVKIINVNEDAAGNVEEEVQEQGNNASEDKPEDIPEVPEDDTDTSLTSPKEPKVEDSPDEANTNDEAETEVEAEVEKETEKKTEDKPEKETEKEKLQENKNDDDDTGKDEPETTNAEEVKVKDIPVEDSVDDSSVKPDDSLEVVTPEPTESDSSSDSSSSSSSSSDSDSDDEKDGVDEPDHDPGKDPDLVAEKLPEQALKVIGVAPGTKHEGSIQPLVEDKKDIELTSLALDSEQVEELASIIDKKEDVGSITLRNTEINDETVEKLVEVLKKSSSVKMLNLNVNRVGPQGAQHIADLIRESKSLRMLLLHGNPLQDEGVHHILDAIISTKDTALNNLDLGDCKMKDDGAKDVARLLHINTTITDLTISGNHIGLSGWRIISSALEQNKTLKSLSLDFSNLGDDEAAILAEGIRENKGLRSLDLEGNRIGDEGGRSLLEAVKVNPTIVDLTLMPMNEISKDICDEIKGILEQRSKSRVSSASSSISSLLSRNGPSRPLKEEAVDDSESGRPTIGSFSEDTKKDEVETSKENEISSSVDKDNENKIEDSVDDTGKSSNEDTPDEDSTLKETENRETTSEDDKELNDKMESSEDKKEIVDNSNDDQKS